MTPRRLFNFITGAHAARKAHKARLAARQAYYGAIARGDTRGQHTAFEHLLSATAAQLRAEGGRP